MYGKVLLPIIGKVKNNRLNMPGGRGSVVDVLDLRGISINLVIGT